MSTIIQFQLLNAFNSKPFTGNRAAVIILDQETKENIEKQNIHQLIAAEINAPATAFVFPKSDGGYQIRWFSADGELNLCGHASLATSVFLFNKLNYDKDATKTKEINYDSGVGPLKATLLDDDRIELEFPAANLIPLVLKHEEHEISDIKDTIISAIQDDSVTISQLRRGSGQAFDQWLLVELDFSDSTIHIKDLKVDHSVIKRLEKYGLTKISLTTRGTLAPSQTSGSPTDFHIISRMFAPAIGHDEDPVTGSMHCLLAPYWTAEFESFPEIHPQSPDGSVTIKSLQASARQGIIEVVWRKEEGTVLIRGEACITGKGELYI